MKYLRSLIFALALVLAFVGFVSDASAQATSTTVRTTIYDPTGGDTFWRSQHCTAIMLATDSNAKGSCRFMDTNKRRFSCPTWYDGSGTCGPDPVPGYDSIVHYLFEYVGECPSGTSPDAESFECVEVDPGDPGDPGDPSSCPYNQVEVGTEGACQCPDGTVDGYRGTVSDGMENWCVNLYPDPDQNCTVESENYLGTINGDLICDLRPNDCPATYQYGYANGEEICIPPLDDPDCPNGGFGEFNGVTQCWDPDPNVSDPDYPGNNDGGDGGDGGDGNGGDGGDGDGFTFDDSRIVSRLDLLRNGMTQNTEAINNQTDSLLDAIDGLELGDGLTEDVADGAAGDITGGVGESIDDAIGQAGSELADSIGDGDAGMQIDSSLKDTILNILPTSNCQDLVINLDMGDFSITCEGTARLREFLAFCMYIFTAYTLFQLAIKPVNR